MIENALKARLASGQLAYGVLSPNYDTFVVEVLAQLGFDHYIFDCEHGPGGPMQALEVVRACETVGITPLARVRSTDPKLILQFLDAGVMGIMMPGIVTAGEVEQLVEAVRYPPVGKRGIAPVRANNYLLGSMGQADYIQMANEQIMILPQIETKSALDNLESIVDVQGVDGFIVGPRDLSMALGFRDGPNHDEVRSTVYRIFDIVREAGLPVGTTAVNGQEAKQWADHGAQIILPSINGLLRAGSTAFWQGAKANEE